jgi:histidinol-phosphate aminotransferase
VTGEVHGDDYARGARLNFAVNVLADPRPPWLADAIARGIELAAAYPDPATATHAVAARHGRAPEEIVLLNGAAEAFSLIARALAPGHPVIVHPAFTEPDRALRDAGAPAAHAVLAEPFLLEAAAVPAGADLLVVGNPTNPTGMLHPAEVITALCRPGRTTVVDEAFMDFVPGQAGTVAATRLPGLIVVRSLTKVLGIPGIRAGYLLAEPTVATRLRAAAPKWPVNSIALAVIEAASGRPAYFEAVATVTRARRERLTARLEAIDGIRVHPGHANFLLLELANAVVAHRRLLEEHGIATRPCWPFPGLDERHLRVAVHGDPLDAELVAALRAICGRRASGRSPAPVQSRR